MDLFKGAKDDNNHDDDDANTGTAPSSPNPVIRKRKAETSTAKAHHSSAKKPKVDGEVDPRIANVPLFEHKMRFPDQLWHLLKYDELNEAIWWLPGDDAFAINEPVFSELLLESHFRGNKFTSIIRKLNRW